MTRRIREPSRQRSLKRQRRGCWPRLSCCGCTKNVLLAAVDLEGPDTGVPIEGAVAGEVFVGVPHRAIVDGVYGHGAVVTPAVEGSLLGAGASVKQLLGAEAG